MWLRSCYCFVVTAGSLAMAGEVWIDIDGAATERGNPLSTQDKPVRLSSGRVVQIDTAHWKVEFESCEKVSHFNPEQLKLITMLLEQGSQEGQFDILDTYTVPKLRLLYDKLKTKNAQTLPALFLKSLIRLMSRKARGCKTFDEVESLISKLKFAPSMLEDIFKYLPPMAIPVIPGSNNKAEGTDCEELSSEISVLKGRQSIQELSETAIFEPRMTVRYDKGLEVLVDHRKELQRFVVELLQTDNTLSLIDPVQQQPLWSYKLNYQPLMLAFDWEAKKLIVLSSKRITVLDVQTGVPIIDGPEAEEIAIAAALLERRKQRNNEAQWSLLLCGNRSSKWGYRFLSCDRKLACWLRSQYLDKRTAPFCLPRARDVQEIYKDCS